MNFFLKNIDSLTVVYYNLMDDESSTKKIVTIFFPTAEDLIVFCNNEKAGEDTKIEVIYHKHSWWGWGNRLVTCAQLMW